MEHPFESQYTQDPVTDDYKNYAGLKVVDVSQRANQVVMVGIGLEALTLLTVMLGVVMGKGVIHTILGHLSLIWFFAVVWVRYDHFGRVCAGEYLGENDTTQFPNLMLAMDYADIYIKIIGLVVSALFGLVLIYSCCVDKPRKSTEEDKE